MISSVEVSAEPTLVDKQWLVGKWVSSLIELEVRHHFETPGQSGQRRYSSVTSIPRLTAGRGSV